MFLNKGTMTKSQREFSQVGWRETWSPEKTGESVLPFVQATVIFIDLKIQNKGDHRAHNRQRPHSEVMTHCLTTVPLLWIFIGHRKFCLECITTDRVLQDLGCNGVKMWLLHYYDSDLEFSQNIFYLIRSPEACYWDQHLCQAISAAVSLQIIHWLNFHGWSFDEWLR